MAAKSEDANSETDSFCFEFGTIRAATNDFSSANKLGEGGFGSVYKGRLSDGQEIAVKRLAQRSTQGELEFKNEIVLMARLQHRNLVRLLGFCSEGKERILIYECIPNGSLDHFIFDPIRRVHLGWERRYKIIGGIARGILYLHQDSRLKIIHRDLKAANVLLDGEMNPKIADFGTARLFVADQSQSNTRRIVGTQHQSGIAGGRQLHRVWNTYVPMWLCIQQTDVDWVHNTSSCGLTFHHSSASPHCRGSMKLDQDLSL